MSWLAKNLTSSLGKKLIMALTGLFLCSFLVIHLIGNLQLLKCDNGEAFNHYAKFMTSNPLIGIVSKLLYASILGHAAWGLYLAFKNKSSRPKGYAVANSSSTWSSRNMGVLGTIILIFIVIHMANFWFEYHYEEMPLYTLQDGTVVKDLYKECAEAFSQLWYTALYVFCMGALAFHLYHGFQSAFQTLGMNHKKYTPLIKGVGVVFSILIPAAFAAIPVIMYCSQTCSVK